MTEINRFDKDIDFGISLQLIGLLSIFLAGTGIDFPASIEASEFDKDIKKKLILMWNLYTEMGLDTPSKEAELLGRYFSLISHIIYTINDRVTDVMTMYTESCIDDVGKGETSEGELLNKTDKVKKTHQIIKLINNIHKNKVGMSNFKIINKHNTDILVCDLDKENGIIYNCIEQR